MLLVFPSEMDENRTALSYRPPGIARGERCIVPVDAVLTWPDTTESSISSDESLLSDLSIPGVSFPAASIKVKSAS